MTDDEMNTFFDFEIENISPDCLEMLMKQYPNSYTIMPYQFAKPVKKLSDDQIKNAVNRLFLNLQALGGPH